MVFHLSRERISTEDSPIDQRGLERLRLVPLMPLHSLATNEYIVPFLDILDVSYLLSNHGVLHGNIAPGNLAYHDFQGRKFGVLMDFDLVMTNAASSAFKNKDPGAIPFLAMALPNVSPNNREPYIYRFDLESLLYVFLWDAVTHPQGVAVAWKLKEFPLRKWLGDVSHSCDMKPSLAFRLDRGQPDSFRNSISNEHYFEVCKKALKCLFVNLMWGYLDLGGLSPDIPQADFETLCGRFTYRQVKDNFEAVRDALRKA